MFRHASQCITALFVICTAHAGLAQQGVFAGTDGNAHFKSTAPLELIMAKSQHLRGVLDPETEEIAFSVRINSFQGFNSVLQRDHFMENYLEESKFPVATFKGKVIERVRFAEPGQHHVRVKGIVSLHGFEQERIIPGKLEIIDGIIHITSKFSIPLKEHAIKVPKLLTQKIAETIFVELDIVMQKIY